MANRTARLLLKSVGTVLAVASLGLQQGCSELFFYPDRVEYTQPAALGLHAEDIYLDTPDGERLHAWWIPARGTAQGTVYFLHGNAQNLSAHLLNAAWLAEQGYNLFALDYRGYGRSTGSPDLDGAQIDIQTGLDWLKARPHTAPHFLLGQSLGGALATLLAAQTPEPAFAGIVLDGTFAGFRQIAREKLDSFWLTWPLQVPLSWTLPADREPADLIAQIAPTPILIIHSRGDHIIPFHHGTQLYAAAGQPRQFLATETPHTATFLVPAYREQVLSFFTRAADNPLP